MLADTPPVLDPCCGGRMMWFDPSDQRCLFGDQRNETLIVTVPNWAINPTAEMLEAGRAAVMAARVASKKWTPRQHYESSGRSMAGIPKDVLDEHGTLTKESEAVMVFGSMIAHRPGGEAHEH